MNPEIKVGDYVIASHWSDAKPNDPWFIGFIADIVTNPLNGKKYFLVDGSTRLWRFAKKISEKKGKSLMDKYKSLEL